MKDEKLSNRDIQSRIALVTELHALAQQLVNELVVWVGRPTGEEDLEKLKQTMELINSLHSKSKHVLKLGDALPTTEMPGPPGWFARSQQIIAALHQRADTLRQGRERCHIFTSWDSCYGDYWDLCKSLSQIACLKAEAKKFDFSSEPQSAELSVEKADSREDEEPLLSDLARDILRWMHEKGIVYPNHETKQAVLNGIGRQGEGKEAFKRLKDAGYTEGQSGMGIWLTSRGVERAKQIM